jgi:solute carrier family 25 protein 34/35
MQNELVKKGAALVYKSPLDCLQKTWVNEGLAGVQRGMGLCMVRDGSKCFWRIGLFDPVMYRIHDTKQDGPAPMWKRMLAGGFCGAIAAVLCNPLDLAKVRVQTAGGLSTVHHSGAESGMSVFRSVIREQGIRGLWVGVEPNMARSIIGTMALMPTARKVSELLKDYGVPEGRTRDAMASFVGSAVMTVAINPMDVIRTRMYNQPRDANGVGTLYSGVSDALVKISKSEGVGALYKGVVPHFVRVGPYTVLSFIIIGELQRLIRSRKTDELRRAWEKSS